MITPIVGRSAWADATRRRVARVAAHPATVLITGPSGTGKELIANAIHAQSPRAEAPFVPVDCAAAAGSLFASQLFGHERGAFTGATHQALGIFRAAQGGTVFLDEMGELDPELQSKLLRVLQERVVVPLGATQPIPIDVRIIAATNRDLEQEVEAGRFRADLFFRLNVVAVRTQPLSLRPEDVRLLCENFFARQQVRHGLPAKRLSEAAMRCLERYHWPGNVRELENVLERAAIFCDGAVIDLDDLPEEIALHSGQPSADGATLAAECDRVSRFAVDGAGRSALPATDDSTSADDWPTMDEVQRAHLLRTLREAGHNQSRASRMLRVHRNALRRAAERLGVDLSPPPHRTPRHCR